MDITPREHELIQKGLLLICNNKRLSERDRKEAELLWNKLLQTYKEDKDEMQYYTRDN